MKHFLSDLLLVCGILILPGLSHGAGADMHPWEALEIEWTAQHGLDDAYVTGLPEDGARYVTVTFQCVEGEAAEQTYRVAGFWDEGRRWQVRFAPPAPGVWSYRSKSRDPGLDGKTGRFSCTAWTEAEKAANPTRRGLVRVCQTGPRAGRYFEYADGTPMLWIGDTWWDWRKRRIPLQRFQHLVDDRVKKGFNVGQLFFAGAGGSPDRTLLDPTGTKPDLDHIRHIERMIRYANSKGMTVWIHAWWGGKDLAGRVGAETMDRWWRYTVDRLAAYNVIWVLAGEYNLYNYGDLGLEYWNDLGRLIDRRDPCDRLISAHPTPPGWAGGDDAPQWSTAEVLHRQSWLDYNQSQTGHGRWRNEMVPSIVRDAYRQRPPKPIVVTEPWYEFVVGSARAADIRFGAWSAILSGAAGHSYGGGHVWRAHVPEAPARRGPWPLETGFQRDTLDYPGAQSVGFMARQLRQMQWWRWEPHPELVRDNPSRYCAADPGHEYLVYLRWGGMVRLDLSASPEHDRFQFRWIDLVDQQVRQRGTVQGGQVRTFHCPEDYPAVTQAKDWVLHVFRTKERHGN